jgi:hypothetical protein
MVKRVLERECGCERHRIGSMTDCDIRGVQRSVTTTGVGAFYVGVKTYFFFFLFWGCSPVYRLCLGADPVIGLTAVVQAH